MPKHARRDACGELSSPQKMDAGSSEHSESDDRESDDRESGDRVSGDRASGDRGSGDRGSGDLENESGEHGGFPKRNGKA